MIYHLLLYVTQISTSLCWIIVCSTEKWLLIGIHGENQEMEHQTMIFALEISSKMGYIPLQEMYLSIYLYFEILCMIAYQGEKDT